LGIAALEVQTVSDRFSSSAVERRFAMITGKAIRRGSFADVRRLEAAIINWLNHWNENTKPFHWTKSAKVIKTQLTKRYTYLRDTTLVPGRPVSAPFCLELRFIAAIQQPQNCFH
jgi:hypothetical protein